MRNAGNQGGDAGIRVGMMIMRGIMVGMNAGNQDSHPDCPHFHPYSPHSHSYSAHFPHSVPRFPIIDSQK